jgi:hypothetical protein
VVKLLIRFGHGLGDVVQASVILKHLAKYRPDWLVTFRCGKGKHTALQGLCHRISHDQEPELRDADYDSVVSLGFFRELLLLHR